MLHDANPQSPVNRKILFPSGIHVNSRVINGIYFIMNGISYGYTRGLFSRIIFMWFSWNYYAKLILVWQGKRKPDVMPVRYGIR